MLTMLIVDDQPSVLEALRQCFALEADLSIVGEAGDGFQAVEMAQALHPDIVVIDLKMPKMDGLAATVAMRAASPNTKIALLSIYDDRTTRSQALAAGAAAFISKHEDAEALLAAIRTMILADA